MRVPSTSMKRPSGGTAFSTCRVVHAENRTRPPAVRPSSTSTAPAIHVTAIIDLSQAPDRGLALRHATRLPSFLEPPAEKIPVSDGHQPLDDCGSLGVGADQDAWLALFDAA